MNFCAHPREALKLSLGIPISLATSRAFHWISSTLTPQEPVSLLNYEFRHFFFEFSVTATTRSAEAFSAGLTLEKRFTLEPPSTDS